MALVASATFAGETPSAEALRLVEATQKALAVNWQCAEAVGIPALYDIQKTIAVTDMQIVGLSHDDAVIMVRNGSEKMETGARADGSKEPACQKMINDAREELEFARATYRKTAGIN